MNIITPVYYKIVNTASHYNFAKRFIYFLSCYKVFEKMCQVLDSPEVEWNFYLLAMVSLLNGISTVAKAIIVEEQQC